MPSCYYK